MQLVKIDAASGDLTWVQNYGVGGFGSDLTLSNETIWTVSYANAPSEATGEALMLIQVDTKTGDTLNQKNIDPLDTLPTVVDNTIWTNPVFEDITIYDIDSLEVVDTIGFKELIGPNNEVPAGLEKMVLLDDIMWANNPSYLVGIDTKTRKLADIVDPKFHGFDLLEVHDDLVWIADDKDEPGGTFGYNPETKELTSSTLYDSPIGNKYHDGYTYDMINPTTIAQIDDATGEQVATYTDLDPFSIAVTDGYLWAHNGNQVFRYETKP